jgi:chemosensory pili system protein ChpA (sensor histidine kinase/response regulator)
MNASLRPQLASGLQWVRGELEQSVVRARSLIEQHIEDPGDAMPLEQAFVELHQVRGTATMIRCHGAAALAGEMNAALQDLIHARVSDREPLFSTLLAATIQLNDYLLAMTDGSEDCVLVLQAAINELRLARGQPVLTDAELFVGQMRALDLTLPVPADHGGLDGAAQQQARKLLPLFQASLLAWIRNARDASTGLARLGKIAEHIAQHAQLPAVHQLWRVIAATVEAALARALDDSMDLKRHIGRAGAQLKVLADRGEGAAAEETGDLTFQLLFLIGRSRAQGARVKALRQAFQLATYLPGTAQIEENRRKIHGPSTMLLGRVADEIRTEFAKVKDRIDLAVRTGSAVAEMDDTRASLKRIADTLAALGLGVLQRVVVNQSAALDGLGENSPPAAWMEIATAILRVENSLENALFHQLRRPRDVESPEQLETRIPASRDLSEGLDALYRESMVNLARVKAAVDTYLKNGSTSELPEATLLVDEIASGFEILGAERAGQLLRRLRRFVSGTDFASLREDRDRADRFADAVACIEYYIESMRDRLPAADRILDGLSRYLDDLEHTDLLALPDFEPAVDAGATQLPPQETVLSLELPAEAPPVAAPPPVASAPAAGDDDPEIREIFLEEAGEVQATLESTLPGWTRDPQNRDALTTIRRAFHTLKGSGRTVGATEIGDFGYAVENLLNRCLNGSIPTSTGVVTTVTEAVALLPALIAAFRVREPAAPAVAELIGRARDYAEGRDPAAAPEADMAAIFREDAREKLEMATTWLAGLDRDIPRHRVDGEVKRAYHTLRGAARVVDAAALSEVAGALEAYLDSLDEAQLQLDAAGLSVLADATATLCRWVEDVGTRAVQAHDAAPWLQRLRALQGDVPQAERADGVDRELVEIFTNEAFDLVQKMEEAIRAWQQAPDSERPPQDLKVISHTLKGSALMASCTPIGNAARALQDRFAEAVSTSAVPDDAAFAELSSVTELLYQQLDGYRDGTGRGDGRELVERIERLRWNAEAPEATVPAAAVELPVSLPELTLADAEPITLETTPALALELPPIEAATPPSDAPLSLVDPFAGDAAAFVEDAPIEIPPVAPAEPEPALDFALDAPMVQSPQDMPLSAQVIGMVAEPPPVVAAPAEDPELLAIFIAEAEELLEGLDQSGAALERDPRSARALNDLQRVLHTFKGSARMAGLMPVGEVAHRVESLLDAMERGSVSADSAFFSRLHNATDALHMALDDLKRGVIPDMARALDDLGGGAAATVAAPQSAVLEPVEAPAPVVVVPEAVAPLGTDQGVAAVDADLIEVFTGEAADLVEQLERAQLRWQVAPSDTDALQDMQRVLHTLKGGARMSGLVAIGDASHDLESLLSAPEAEADPQARVSAAVAQLRAMVDRLERGDLDALMRSDGVAGAAAATPVAPATEVSAAQPAAPAPAAAAVAAAGEGWDPELFWRPAEEAESLLAARRETARVPVEMLDRMLNEAGEISIFRSRLEEHNSGVQAQLDEMSQAIQRIREQMRQLQAETDAQIAARGLGQTENADRYAGEFDPLEMDRYTRMQELTRALNESISDLAAVHGTMDSLASEAVTILLQQGRVNTEVQQGLMRTLMVPFSRQAARLQRLVQQAAAENGKRAEVEFSGIEAELDRNVLERMTAPLEHLMRNAVVHGIEMPDARSYAGKDPTGRIAVTLGREGTQLFIELRDDGRGLDFQAIRDTAVKRGLMPAGVEINDEEAAQFIFMPGFSTARQLTQDAGRGVGMDVVAAEVKQLGGTLEIASETGKGARFLIRLPLTLAMSQALLVGVGGEQFAVPLPSIEGIARVPREDLDRLYAEDGASFRYGNADYRVRYLGDFVGIARDPTGEPKTLNAILVRLPEGLGAGERRIAMVVDSLIGNREVVSKALGPQVSVIPGVTGATILADGRVVLIIDVAALAQDRTRRTLRSLAAAGGVAEAAPVEEIAAPRNDLVMVVDDSITIRRVTERLLVKQGFRVITAKDGLDAMAQLQTESPAAILLDIEMPRADGFEVATFVRNSQRIARTPIIMITSRSGDKHRERARSIGVDRYLIKPYLEDQLLEELRAVIARAAGVTA